jgi:hypothetical protein
MKPKQKKLKDSVMNAAVSLERGGRAAEKDLKEIAESSIVTFLSAGLTLEQAETVLKMATLELARLSNESLLTPKTPEIEVKIKKGKTK